MKRFLDRYGSPIIKLYITQFVIGLFGIVVDMAISSIEGIDIKFPLSIAVSIFSIIFYGFLVYFDSWTIGAKDRISIDVKTLKKNNGIGFAIGALASLPNYLFATIHAVSWFIAHGEEGTATVIGTISRLIFMISEGMYTGIITQEVYGTKLLEQWWVYFIIPIIGILITGIAYILGVANVKATKLFDPVMPASDREQKPKKKD